MVSFQRGLLFFIHFKALFSVQRVGTRQLWPSQLSAARSPRRRCGLLAPWLSWWTMEAGDRELAKGLTLPVAPARCSNFPYSLSWTLWLPWQGHNTLYVMQKIFPSKVLCLQLWNWLVAFSPPRVSTGSCSCYFKTAAVKSVWERKVLCIMYRKKFQKCFSFLLKLGNGEEIWHVFTSYIRAFWWNSLTFS